MRAPVTRAELDNSGFVFVCRGTDSGVLVEIFGHPVQGCAVALVNGRFNNSAILDYWRASWWELPRQIWRSLRLNLGGKSCHPTK